MPAKAVFFDAGNVLVTWDLRISFERFKKFNPAITFERYYDFTYNKSTCLLRETALDVHGFYLKMREFIGEGFSEEEFIYLWGDIFRLNPDIEEVLRTVPADVPIFVLSNIDATHWRFIENEPVVKKYFPKSEQHVLSFRVGAMKPDRRIYEAAIARANCRANDVVFIDDLPENLFAFSELGARTILYDCRNNSKEYLIASLAEEL